MKYECHQRVTNISSHSVDRSRPWLDREATSAESSSHESIQLRRIPDHETQADRETTVQAQQRRDHVQQIIAFDILVPTRGRRTGGEVLLEGAGVGPSLDEHRADERIDRCGLGEARRDRAVQRRCYERQCRRWCEIRRR